jgi:predicted aminopeptidase
MSRRALKILVRLRALAVIAAGAPLAGCYLLQAAQGQLALNARRVPIARLVADPQTPAALRTRLELALQLRDFASRELGLPDNASYRSYADLGRRYVVWNVVAAGEFSVDARTWCFPIAGCVAYRGYFSERRAQNFALGLEARGLDTLVVGAAAYSTLGHFADPVLNTMLDWDDSELAALVFHELAHQLLYVPGDSAFNEGFATVVEAEGVRRWLASGGRSAALEEFRAREARATAVEALIAQSRIRLRALYAEPLAPAEMRARKRAEFARLRQDYAALQAHSGNAGYEWLFGPQMNNATLLAIATYRECVPSLAAELARAAGDLAAFFAAARQRAQLDAGARCATAQRE